MKQLRSRILEFFPKECILALNKLKNDLTIYNNNSKVDMALDILENHDIDFVKLGPGTNRLAILIDNYVFKIALDDEGVRDNRNEFIMSQELQPYVLKVYECNNIISVSEYVTLISLDEFAERCREIEDILEIFSKRYLFGDLGTIKKNFQNWGYRSDNSLVALDFAYMYPVEGTMMICQKCNNTIFYNKDYSEMACPNCGEHYDFWKIRRRIDMNRIDRFIEDNLNDALVVDKPITPIEESTYYDNMYVSDEDLVEVSLYSKNNRDILDRLDMVLGLYVKTPWSGTNLRNVDADNITDFILGGVEDEQED